MLSTAHFVSNPSKSTSCGGKPQSGDGQNCDVADLFVAEASLSRVSNRGVGGALKTSADRQCELNEAATAFIQRTRLMTPFSQIGEGGPYLGIEFLESCDRSRKFS